MENENNRTSQEFIMYHNSDLDIGTIRSPVSIFADSTFRPQGQRKRLLSDRFAKQLRTEKIHVIGMKFAHPTPRLLAGITHWISDDNANGFSWTDLPPGTYSITLPHIRRDLLEAEGLSPSKLGRINNRKVRHEYVTAVAQFLQLLLSRLWGDDKDDAPNNYVMSNVLDKGTFVITLEPIIGHRDFIRVVLSAPLSIMADASTSILFDDVAGGIDSTQDTNESGSFVDHTAANRHWYPWPGFPTSVTVTYHILPTGVTTPSPDSSHTPDRSDGIYVTCTVDISKSSVLGKPDSDVHFEYVNPNSTYPHTRQFFVAFHHAICLPAFVSVRFSSHAQIKAIVICHVHEYKPDKLMDSLDEVSILQQSKAINVGKGHFPFLPETLKKDGQKHCPHSLCLRDNYIDAVQLSSREATPAIHVGVIPVFKTIESNELRSQIMEARPDDPDPDSLSEQAIGIPSIVGEDFPEDSNRGSVYNHLAQRSGKGKLVVSNMPLEEIGKTLSNTDYPLTGFVDFKYLKDNLKVKRDQIIESESE